MSTIKLFGSSGIRGDAKELFTDQLCFDLGRTFALLLDHHNAMGSIVVAMDPRDSSPRIKNSLIKGLRAGLRNVVDDAIMPIPAVNWALRSDKDTAGSIMITGSHIKAHLNGLKFFAFGDEILKTHEQEIQNIYNDIANKISVEDFQENNTFVKPGNHILDYEKYLISKARLPYKKLKVVVDAGNGAQSDFAPSLLKKLGLEVIGMYTNVQDSLLSRDTEVSGDFTELQKTVLDEKADLGIGFDSDGDRVIFIDEKGRYIPGDFSGTLIALASGTKKTVTPVNTSQAIDSIGLEVYRTKVGSPFVVEKMQEVGASFGFEANGGGIFSDMYSRDGGRSMIEFLNLINQKNMKVSELVATLPKLFVCRDKIDYDWSKKDEIISLAKNTYQGKSIDEKDGLKIYLDENTWILFRSSANAPEFRIFVESNSQERAESELQKGMQLVSAFKS